MLGHCWSLLPPHLYSLRKTPRPPENSEMTTTCTLGTDGAELIMLLAD
jgi:hypothetical protein